MPGERKHQNPPKNFTEGLQTPDSPAAHLESLMSNDFNHLCAVTFLTVCMRILHLIPMVGLSSLPQGGSERGRRRRALELTSVALSREESFAWGKDVQIGLGCLFSSGFQSLSASPI